MWRLFSLFLCNVQSKILWCFSKLVFLTVVPNNSILLCCTILFILWSGKFLTLNKVFRKASRENIFIELIENQISLLTHFGLFFKSF